MFLRDPGVAEIETGDNAARRSRCIYKNKKKHPCRRGVLSLGLSGAEVVVGGRVIIK